MLENGCDVAAVGVAAPVGEEGDLGPNSGHAVLIVTHHGSRRPRVEFLQQELGAIETSGRAGR